MEKDFEYFIKKANRDIQYCEEKGYCELKEYVASLLYRNEELEKENKKLKEKINEALEFYEQYGTNLMKNGVIVKSIKTIFEGSGKNER